MANTIYLTKQGLIDLQKELEELKSTKRVEIAEKLKEAISFGDLSENSEYEDARNEQAQVELRISDLEEQLKSVEIIKESSDSDGRINMGSVVEVENIDNKEKEILKIVGSTESNILAKVPLISNESPVGKALLGKNKGDKVKVTAQSGMFEYKILNVK